MGLDLNRKLMLLIVSLATPVIMVGCTPTSTQLPQNQQPIEVISVLDTYKAGQTISPAGPTIEITLKNTSNEPVVSLNVALEELGSRTFSFDFNVTSLNPLLPNKITSAKRTLVGGGFGGGITYSLMINGTLQNGTTFAYIWEPSNK